MAIVLYEEKDLESIAFELKNFKVAIVLTDTIFGFLAINKKEIYKIKNRKFYKKIIQLIPNVDYLKKINSYEEKMITKYWPGAVTFIKKGKSYRIPNDSFLLNLLSKTGPLYTSSANISGHAPVESISQARQIFSESKFSNNIIYINRDKSISKLPSTVFDLDKKRLLRQGEINIYEK